MRIADKIENKPLENPQFCELVKALTKEKYRPIIDPRNFDNPKTINARFKTKEKNIRFIEISPTLDIVIEHNGTKKEGEDYIKEIKTHVTNSIPKEAVNPEDFEQATLQMISRKEPVISPRNTTEKKLFEDLVVKGIFTRVHLVGCPKCENTLMLPKESTNLSKKAFCKDCEEWFKIKSESDVYVMNEEYMDVMNNMWGKVNKMIKASWREVVKKGMPMIPKV